MIPKLPSYFGLLLLYSGINILLIRPFQVISTNGYLFHYSQMGRVGGSRCSNWNMYKHIFHQLSTSIPPENIRKPEVFWGYNVEHWLKMVNMNKSHEIFNYFRGVMHRVKPKQKKDPYLSHSSTPSLWHQKF